MLRYLTYAVSALCGVVLLATLLLWYRSSTGFDSIYVGEPWNAWHELSSADGVISYEYERVPIPDTRPLMTYGPRSNDWVLSWGEDESHGTQQHWAGLTIVCPHWFVVVACTPPVIWVAHRWWYLGRRHRRRRQGFCWACGFDLRASPERCPECGTPRAVIHNSDPLQEAVGHGDPTRKAVGHEDPARKAAGHGDPALRGGGGLA
jgi:hypothetical protein